MISARDNEWLDGDNSGIPDAATALRWVGSQAGNTTRQKLFRERRTVGAAPLRRVVIADDASIGHNLRAGPGTSWGS